MMKHESALLTQLCTRKIGFNAFLYMMRVPEVLGPHCDCLEGAMTGEHVLLKCPKWITERTELISPLCTNDITEILTSKARGKAAARMIQRKNILDQFKVVEEQEEGR
jgi:hypothetical protein